MKNTTNTTIYMSRGGRKDTKKRIVALRKQLAHAMGELRELDRADDNEGRHARIEKFERINSLESELTELEARLSTAKLLPRKRDALKVALGSVVDLVDQQGRLMTYTIVESFEADPSDGRISILSPLGKSLVGKSVQQTIEWTSGRLAPRKLQLVAIH